LEIYSENLLNERYEVDTEVFRESAAEMLASLLGPDGEGSVVFVSDDEIRELNRSYRNVDRPTDVLSFCCADDPFSQGVIGDIYISLETAERQARERAVPLAEETLRLLVHGVLHLVGHTHDEEEDAATMRRHEEELFARYRDRIAGTCRARTGPAADAGTAEENDG